MIVSLGMIAGGYHASAIGILRAITVFVCALLTLAVDGARRPRCSC